MFRQVEDGGSNGTLISSVLARAVRPPRLQGYKAPAGTLMKPSPVQKKAFGANPGGCEGPEGCCWLRFVARMRQAEVRANER
jgi:hypothetical protein